MPSSLFPNQNNSMLDQFFEFKKQMQGKDAKAIVQDLLQSGQMSQAQFEQLKKQANTFSQLIK